MRFLAACWTQLWITLVVGLLLTALYTSLGRQLIPLVETRQADIEQLISEQLGQPVSMSSVQGGWRYVTPVLRLTDVHIGSGPDALVIAHLQLELDVARSLYYRLPVFSRIEISGVNAHLRREEGRWFLGQDWALTPVTASAPVVAPVPAQTLALADSSKPLWATILEHQDRIFLRDWMIDVEASAGLHDRISIKSLLLQHQGNKRSLTGQLAYGRDNLAEVNLDAFLSGPVWPVRQQSGAAYLELAPQSLDHWIPDDLPMGLHVDALESGGRLWLTMDEGTLSEIYADLSINRLQLLTRATPLSIDEGRIRVGGVRSGEDWHLRVLPELGETVPIHNLTLSHISLPQQSGWQLGIPSLAVGDVVQYLLGHALLPSPFDRYLGHIAPSGEANDIRISLLPGKETQVDVRARLNQVSGATYMGIPGFSGVDADLHLQPFQGVVDIYHQPLQLQLEGVYVAPWEIDDLTARVNWDIRHDESRVWVTGIQARSGHLDVRGELAMHLPSSHSPHRESLFSLLLGIPEASVADRQRLVPDLVEKEVRDWLEVAIEEGRFSKGVFMLNGTLAENHPRNALTTQLYMRFNDARVNYLEGWPAVSGLDGVLKLDTPALDIQLDGGKTLGGNLLANSARVSLSSGNNKTTNLLVSGQIQGPLKEALDYFHSTPLQAVVKNSFDSWSGTGSLLTDFRLAMALGPNSTGPAVQISTRISNSTLNIGDLGLGITALQGRLDFDSLKGLSSQSLKGQVMGGDFQASVTSKPETGGFSSAFVMTGRATMAAYKQWSPLFLLDPVTGDLGYQAGFRLNTATGSSLFELSTALDGVRIDYPAPFFKEADNRSHVLSVKVKPGRETRISLDYDKTLRAVFALDKQGVNRGQVYLGGEEPFLPSDAGIEVRGSLTDTVKAEEWWALWERLQPLAEASAVTVTPAGSLSVITDNTTAAHSNSGSAANNNPLRRIDLRLSDLSAWTMGVGESRITADQSWGEWRFGIESNLVKGDITLEPDASPLQVHLEYLHLPPPESKPATVVVSASAASAASAASIADTAAANLKKFRQALDDDMLKEMEPANFPSADVRLDEVFLGGWNLGAWTLNSRPQPDGLHLTVTEGLMKGMNISGDLYWVLDDWGHNTRIENLQIRGKNLAEVQKAFRQDVIVEGKSYRANMNLQWMGSPMAFNTQSLDGQAAIRIEDGNWKTEGTGALKAFGVLNFNSISRRLQLDFSDLYQSGVAFDVTRARVDVKNGLLTFSEPLVVDGPGAKFLASGNTNLNDESLDLKLAVTFPVTGSLPIVAVLTGFAAPIAGAIYVTQKLIGDELERFTSASYDVGGYWSDPKMKIRQAFDNDVDGKQSRSFKDRFLSIFGMEESK